MRQTTNDTATPRKGLRFRHTRFINEDRSPAVFVITRVTRDMFWYAQSGTRRATYRAAIEDACSIIAEVR